MRVRMGGLVCVLVGAVVSGLSAQNVEEPSLATVLARAGEYVLHFQRDLSNVVAEERYTQEVRRSVQLLVHRDLKSDLLLVRSDDGYVQFRDVFEVDGRAVRDRNNRLQKLFLESSKSSIDEARRIMTESARYNVGAINRNINLPTLSLTFLEPTNQPRFKFSRFIGDAAAQSKGLPRSANFKSSTDLWVIEYREVAPQTMIRTTARRDLPSHGRFWIEPSSGRVFISELMAEDTGVFGTINVSYQSQPGIGLLVPIEMREADRRPGRDERITGTATYGNFQQFQVQTDETGARAKN